jgi:hypothetical protein
LNDTLRSKSALARERKDILVTWKLKLLHTTTRSQIVLVLVNLPECSTDVFMVLLVHLIVLLAAMSRVSTIRTLISRWLALGLLCCLLFVLLLHSMLLLAYRTRSMGSNPVCLGANRGQRGFTERVEEVGLLKNRLELGRERIRCRGFAGGKE